MPFNRMHRIKYHSLCCLSEEIPLWGGGLIISMPEMPLAMGGREGERERERSAGDRAGNTRGLTRWRLRGTRWQAGE